MHDPNKTGSYLPDTTLSRAREVSGSLAQPAHIDRYRVESILGKGGFGQVYNLAGGIIAWQKANLPLEKATGKK